MYYHIFRGQKFKIKLLARRGFLQRLQEKTFCCVFPLLLFVYSIVVGLAVHRHESAMGVHVSPSRSPLPPPSHPIPLGCPSAPAQSALFHASNLDWSSISHMVIHMLQCYSLKSSHPHLLPQSPKVCSLHLCLFCYLTYRVAITIFLNSMYMYQYTILVFFFLTYFCLYNRLQFHPPHQN